MDEKCDEWYSTSVKLKLMIEELANNITDQIDSQLRLSDADREDLFRGILAVICDAADFIPYHCIVFPVEYGQGQWHFISCFLLLFDIFLADCMQKHCRDVSSQD